ncbi:hypothetical protein LSH36_1129g00056 [Paralvinella palmiformis]|uniref:Uncharacterized protein n=1 Tax=Paralvinella palmiformis TaxID=53620 RepID=A0AAD9MRL8_9ANNE|nr:hypothetical protein LSH36_1129g00056 [Paralvinella palmiformis]
MQNSPKPKVLKMCELTEWARFCGRQACAEAISKYIHSKKYFFKKTFLMSREKWKSEPDLIASTTRSTDSKDRGSWITRHLSMKRKKRGHGAGSDDKNSSSPSIAETARGGSAPELNLPCSPEPERKGIGSMRRPSCFENVVPVNIMPKLRMTNDVRRRGEVGIAAISEEPPRMEPPKILETDFDNDMERLAES